jgi:DNA invertase Pin-like site-specific DNA recombinase
LGDDRIEQLGGICELTHPRPQPLGRQRGSQRTPEPDASGGTCSLKLVVWKLDRLGRNMTHILQTVKEVADRGATLVSSSDGIDSSTPAGRIMIGVLCSLAEYERELTKERTALKRATSRARGVKFGRPRKVDDAAATKARSMREKGITASDIAKMLGVSRATAYR